MNIYYTGNKDITKIFQYYILSKLIILYQSRFVLGLNENDKIMKNNFQGLTQDKNS